ncbi:hypothetical protein QBC34DRAFT_412900 [Podospora aff. communis PSN243]|uniref:AAA+ ATPase domain-containing protein n=1 Tax=Podospora aff. communis PSN243 TaxID=3040156 RepID=A0AAV9GC81_9PEZI|nr:hypothetical protein QBC34DRAFT_412900 [Podospora aff. communis PSN243]
MSYADFHKVLPGHFAPAVPAGTTAPAAPAAPAGTDAAEQPSNNAASSGGPSAVAGDVTQQKPLKGFIDIVEYHKEHDLGGGVVDIIPTSRFFPKGRDPLKKTPQYEDYALVLRRTWTTKRGASVLVRIELEIQSERLCEAFREIAKDSYDTTDLLSSPIKLRSPFSELFFHRTDIKQLAEDTTKSEDLRRDAKALHEFIQSNTLLSSITRDYNKYSKHGQVMGDILWTIYPPNSLIVVSIKMIRECWICRNVSMQITPQGLYYWVISGLRIGFNGDVPGLIRQTFQMPVIGTQVCKISELALIPLQQHPERESLEALLRERAKALREVLGHDLSSFMTQSYTGPAWEDAIGGYSSSFDPSAAARHIDERVVVDYKAYLEANSISVELEDLKDTNNTTALMAKKRGRGILLVKHQQRRRRRYMSMRHGSDSSDTDADLERDIGPIDIDQDPTATLAASDEPQAPADPNPTESDLTDLASLQRTVTAKFRAVIQADFELIFPALVPAFGLKEKGWQWILADRLEMVTWNTTAFDSLQLDPVTKDLIKALIRGHKVKTANIFDDVIKGKGQGLIFLLHGQPGLGKTLTAESVADFLERPLYSISGGELTTSVDRLEGRLNSIFNLTKRWNAVSLLDEADVLLCKRNSSEMDRNAIVGVFLRKLEYFQGVLILTTNRKDDFDDAFKSRIHVTISYQPIPHQGQIKIWKALLESNPQVEIDESWTPEMFSACGKLDFNGRTIKNILRTAVAYANAETGVLNARHVLAIVQTELKDEILGPTTKAGLEEMQDICRKQRSTTLKGKQKIDSSFNRS